MNEVQNQSDACLPPSYAVCGKVMFSLVSVCLYFWRGPYMTGYMRISPPPPVRPVQTCFTWGPPSPKTCWQAGGWPSAERPSRTESIHITNDVRRYAVVSCEHPFNDLLSLSNIRFLTRRYYLEFICGKFAGVNSNTSSDDDRQSKAMRSCHFVLNVMHKK